MAGSPKKRAKRSSHGQFLPRYDPPVVDSIAATAIQDYIAGVSVQDIAARHGVDRGIIYDWMLGQLGPDQYHELIVSGGVNSDMVGVVRW